MRNGTDRPSTETDRTPRPPEGQDIKSLVTPGDPAAEEAEAEQAAAERDAAEPDQASPEPGEAPEEERSPT